MSNIQQDFDQNDLETLTRLKVSYSNIRQELSKVIVGQNDVIHQLLLAIFSKGHCILEGVPGLAKTLLISSLAKTLQLDFNRIQFTPDLMPADITGTEIVQENKNTGERLFRFIKGPIFSNIILADEINRTPPKTQSALLEAMQERQVTVNGQRHILPDPFFVLATQNPIEQEGTYPLPEAQQDRFMFKIFVKYPSFDEEYQIAQATTSNNNPIIERALSITEITEYQAVIRKIPVAPLVIRYALKVVRATRLEETDLPFIKDWLSWGAGPRAVQNLLIGAKAQAGLSGRHFVTIDDIKAIALPVLRHRIITNFSAEADGITSDKVISRILEVTPLDDNANIHSNAESALI